MNRPDKCGYAGYQADTAQVAIATLEDTPGDLARLAERAGRSLRDAIPPNTRAAYQGDLRRFAAWCTGAGLAAMPATAETLVLYMRTLADAGRKVSTIERAVAALSTAYTRAGYPSPWNDPLVSDMRAALRRELGTRPKKMRAADDEILRRLLAVIPDTLLGKRDRCLLALGWCGALRRSELIALDVCDVTRAPKGLVVLIRAGKTDQEARGEEVPIFFSNSETHCPVRTLDAWLAAAEIVEGPILRRLGRRQQLGDRLSPEAVLERVRHWAKVAGLQQKDFGAHSLRSGFITTAARRGKDLDSIMRTSRHRSERTARGYIQRETLHERGAGEGLL